MSSQRRPKNFALRDMLRPLQPEAVMPDTARTIKRVVRATTKELAQPKQGTAPKTAEPIYRTPRLEPKPIVIPDWRKGWSHTWEYWNKISFKEYFASPTSRATNHEE